MSEVFSGGVLLLMVVWPLLLVVGVAFSRTRPLALTLTPWAAVPALVVAMASDDARLGLPGAMLGSSVLVLDVAGRVFLTLVAGLWLASGLLARPRLRATGSGGFTVLWLLAMSGGVAMALAGDALLFFTATTLAGYALYGLLVHHGQGPAHRAGRVLLVLFVVSDLLVVELLMILSHQAASVEFAALRRAFGNFDGPALPLGLLVVGFGIKLGVAGLHFWLAPAFTTAAAALRPALIGFMLGAGLLGWLRLTPLGEVQWLAAGGAVQWLAWITLGYAMIAGVLQAQVRSMLAYVAVALSAFWVALLGAALMNPQVWDAVAEAAMPAMLQSGFALTILMLLSGRAAEDDTASRRPLGRGLQWLAVWLLAAAPVGVAAALGVADDPAVWQLRGVTVVTAFLAVRGLLLVAAASRNAHALSPATTIVQRSTQVFTPMTLFVAVGLTAAASLAAAFNLVGRWSAELGVNTLMMAAAAIAAWLTTGRFVPRLPVIPSGDLLIPISDGLAATFDRGQRLGSWQLPLWRDAALALVRRSWFEVHWFRVFEWIESGLDRWRIVLMFFLVLGLTLAWWGGGG